MAVPFSALIAGCGYVGLLPRWGRSGNRTPKLPEALAKLEEVLASAPFHLNELEGLGFKMT